MKAALKRYGDAVMPRASRVVAHAEGQEGFCKKETFFYSYTVPGY
jgi:hypothetical protein